MAQRVQVLLTCDIHGDDTPGTETVTFALDGSSYVIDVCDDHAARMRDDFATYIGAGRRSGGRGAGAASGTRRGRGRRPAAGAADPADVRAWARSNGIAVNERGRIPANVLEQYAAAQS